MIPVDDEPAARRKVRSFLAEALPEAELLEAENGPQAVGLILDHHPSLVLLDIQMPGMTGFEVIEAVGAHRMPPVIFITAYDAYAVEAFRLQAVDYLLKPFDADRFQQALQRARRQIAMTVNYEDLFQRLLREVHQDRSFQERILVNIGSRYFFLPVEEILFITAEDKYLSLHTADKRYLLRETMTSLETKLDPAPFVRIHRSHLVNVDYIRDFHPRAHVDYDLVLKNGTQLVVSRRYRERLFGG